VLHPSDEAPQKKISDVVNNNNWIADMRLQFEELNHHIASAITDKNFTRAIALDTARQDALKDLCLKDPALIDKGFFAFIECCARENASLISKIENEMEELTTKSSQQMRMQIAYSR
jgi:hypothetical protein